MKKQLLAIACVASLATASLSAVEATEETATPAATGIVSMVRGGLGKVGNGFRCAGHKAAYAASRVKNDIVSGATYGVYKVKNSTAKAFVFVKDGAVKVAVSTKNGYKVLSSKALNALVNTKDFCVEHPYKTTAGAVVAAATVYGAYKYCSTPANPEAQDEDAEEVIALS